MDHEVVNIRDSYMSCGVMELSRIDDDITKVLYAIGSRLYHPSRGNPCAMFVFSDVADTTSEKTTSSKLIKRVKEYFLGQTGETPRVENPRTGNMITTYWWIIDHEKFKSWYATMRKAKLGKVGA